MTPTSQSSWKCLSVLLLIGCLTARGQVRPRRVNRPQSYAHVLRSSTCVPLLDTDNYREHDEINDE